MTLRLRLATRTVAFVALALGLLMPMPDHAQDPAAPAPSEGPTAEEAAALVADFHEQLLQVMQSGAEFEGRVSMLGQEISELFDVATISRISLGRKWKELDDTAQGDFASLLEELIVATYADRFDSYNDQVFHHVAVDPTRRGWVVKTQLEKSDGDRVTMDYYFRAGKVFDVVADGVSDLSLRRADYNSIIKSEGYDQLLAHIRENIAKHSAADAD